MAKAWRACAEPNHTGLDDKEVGLADGSFAVAWEDNSAGVGGAGGDTDGSAIKAQLFTFDGLPIDGEFLVNTKLPLHNHGTRGWGLD